jgi:hypothetical protein
MPEVFEMSAQHLNQAVYVAIATTKDDPKLEILAGITYYTLRTQPNLTTNEILEGITALGVAIEASSPDLQVDHSPNESMYMSRVLPRLLPRISDEIWKAGARKFSLSFLDSYRRQVNPSRQVASIDTQFDQFGEVDRFRRDMWNNLFEFAAENSATAEVIDQSRIAQKLGLQTSENATALLERVPIATLKAFVSSQIQPNGGVRAELADLQKAVKEVSDSALNLNKAWTDVLRELGLEKPEPELKKAIEKAKEKQKELDGPLGDARAAVKGALLVFAFIASKSNDPDFAKDIEKFSEITVAVIDVVRKYSKGAITVAEKAAGLAKLGVTGFSVIAGIGFTAGLVAVGMTIFGILNRKQANLDAIILQQVQAITNQIRDLRAELQRRFERIENQLNVILDTMLEQFQRINFELGQIEGNIEEIQLALFSLQSNLVRFNRNVHLFIEAAERRELVEAINGFLNFRERTGQDLDLTGFLEAENQFFSWAFSHSSDEIQAGPADRDFEDGDLLEELQKFPLAANINFLRAVPARRFGLPPLSTIRLANPSTWIAGSEGYCQLSEESPAHAANISSGRVQDLITVGESLGTGLSRIADRTLLNALADHYLAQFELVKAELADFETSFRVDPANGLFGIDPWGGANQELGTHFLQKAQDLPRCDGKSFSPDTPTVRIALSDFDHSELRSYMIASNLGLGSLDACVAANWTKKSVTPIFGERFEVVFQLIINVRVRFAGAVVFEHRFESDKTFKRVLLKAQLDTFDPNSESDAHLQVDSLKNKLSGFPSKHTLVNPQLREATVSAVEAALKLSQRTFYSQVAQKFDAAGDRIGQAGARLTGSKLLWQSFIVMGLPLSVESNEFLRSLLFGSEAIPAGSDAEGKNAAPDDLQDIYGFFASAEEPPAVNIISEIEALVNRRVETLRATLTDIVGQIESSGEPEPPELFAPTLLRLSLIPVRPA